jgi:homoserine dehydrogenase
MSNPPHRLALIGFGVVGQALAEIIQTRQAKFQQTYNLDLHIVAVSDLLKGAVYHPNGLDPAKLLETVKSTGTLDAYPNTPGLERGWDSFKTIRESNAATIIEVSYTDINTGQPAIDHCLAAFESGKNVVMSNKGPIALAYAELSTLAKEKGVQWHFESTVLSGTPALRMPLTALVGNEITAVSGIFNGTTNYILTKMEEGLSYKVALKQAQELGYAEADPTADVEGYDTLGKVIILANVVMNAPLTKDDIPCQGISQLTLKDIEQAKIQGKRWKLIGRARKEDGHVIASVGPEMIPLTDPLAGVTGATNAITYHTDLVGPVTLVGAGAGGKETAAGILADVINITNKFRPVQ